jgi:hypothetical protein
MRLREFFTVSAVRLGLDAKSKDDVLKELIGLLGLDEKSQAILFKTLKRRENLGSTGIGKGIAIPHCRSLVVNSLRLAYGRKPRSAVHASDQRAGSMRGCPTDAGSPTSFGSSTSLLNCTDSATRDPVRIGPTTAR